MDPTTPRRTRLPTLVVAMVLAMGGCPCSEPANDGTGEGSAGDEQAPNDGEERDDDPARDRAKPVDEGDEQDEGAEPDEPPEPPRSEIDLPPPASSRPSDAIRRASEPTPPLDDERRPIAPPEEPPDNPFGYDRPVLGCIEGRVHLVREGIRRIPRRWDRLEHGPTLWACEWNVEPHIWEDGLPGMQERYQWFAVRYEGAFRVREPGTYGFRLRSDDGSRLLIDGEVVVDNGGMHAAISRDGEVELAAGDHTMVLEYVQGPHHVALQLWVTPPDGQEGLLSVRWD